jgi:hypothetical protein
MDAHVLHVFATEGYRCIRLVLILHLTLSRIYNLKITKL